MEWASWRRERVGERERVRGSRDRWGGEREGVGKQFTVMTLWELEHQAQLVMWGNGHLGWMRWWGRWKELQECGWVHGPCVNVIYERKLRSHVACFNNSFIWEMDHSDWGRTIPIMYMFHAISFFLTTEKIWEPWHVQSPSKMKCSSTACCELVVGYATACTSTLLLFYTQWRNYGEHGGTFPPAEVCAPRVPPIQNFENNRSPFELAMCMSWHAP